MHGSVDAHLHLWDLGVSAYAWLTPDHGPLHATYTADMARAELDLAGVDRAVLVQAEDSERDTEFLCETATRHPWVAGVVGWVRLDAPAEAERSLDRLQRHPAFCGVRHLVHQDPRGDFLALPTVRRSLSVLAERTLPFDVPDAWPRHLDAATELASALPRLTVVLDHLGKPPVDGDGYDRWREQLRAFAARPNTVAKVSGLHTPGGPYPAATLRATWETALDLLGPARLMYGGDWPMTVPVGGYQPTCQVTAELVAELSGAEQRLLWGGTARAVYGLGPGPGDS